jgi:regulator of protease activity HflC (stomatin/prohibitin superfamily)
MMHTDVEQPPTDQTAPERAEIRPSSSAGSMKRMWQALAVRLAPRRTLNASQAQTRTQAAVRPARRRALGLLGRASDAPPRIPVSGRVRKKGLSAHLWILHYVLENMALAERVWGRLRLVVALAAVALFVVLSWLFAGSSYNLLSIRGLRHIIFPLTALLGAFLVAGHYVQDIYELPKTRQAFRYLFYTVFGFMYPTLRIENGEKKISQDDTNLVDTIGGPGLLVVQPGNAVLCERLTEPAAVFGGGYHFLSRFETVKEIVSLQDQHGRIDQAFATTRDGIEVIVRDISYRYRVRNGRRYGDYNRRTPEQPYPFSMQALRNLTYNRTVSANGISSWHDAVRGAVNSVITDYVQSVTFDQLTETHVGDLDPRQAVNSRLHKKDLRERLKRTGAELLWCDIGRFDPPEKVDDIRVGFWAVPWAGDALVQRAQGEGRRMRLQEQGRAEGQAELLRSIMQSLSSLDLTGGHPDNMRKLVLIRTAQILEAIAESPSHDGEKSPQQKGPEKS